MARDVGAPKTFPETHWSLVVRARYDREAFSELFSRYRDPLLAYLTAKGCDPTEAQEVAQQLFGTFLARHDLNKVDRGRGQFRNWLKVAARHAWFRSIAVPPGAALVSLDASKGDRHFELPSPDELADRAFDRCFARALVDRAIQRVGESYAHQKNEALFEQLRACWMGDHDDEETNQTLAERLGTNANNVRQMRSRLRAKVLQAVRDEVRAICEPGESVDDIIKELIRDLLD
jgi:DNA-directed RNA polymerase specialized sigma24 family protein